MMSADSSLTKFIKEQKTMLWRRLPLVALSSLMYFLYYIFGTIVLIQHQRVLSDNDLSSAALSFPLRAAEAVSAHAGLRGAGWFIGFTGAIILGIQSFSYLFKTQTVDFYESRPEKRSVRFRNIAVNSFIIYAVPSLMGAILSFLIAVASGAAYAPLLSEIILTWVFNSVAFLAVYGMSAFATLLTGTLCTALLMNLYVFGIELLIRFTIFGYRAAYYATFDSDNELSLLTGLKSLPPFNLLMGVMEAGIFAGFDVSGSYISKALPYCLKGSGVNLLITVIAFVLAFLAYKYRRAEDAGKAVVNPYAALIIKYSAGVFFALDAGLLIYWIFDRQGMSLPAVILTMITTIVVTSLILEAIFALNVRAALKRAYDMPVILVLSLVILFIFKMDVFGYDSWIPSTADVESAWLVNYSYDLNLDGSYYEDAGYIDIRKYAERNMYLSDIDDMCLIAGEGQNAKVNIAKEYGMNYSYEANGFWNATVGWRMKNGHTITRNISIPEDIDPAVMDRIVGTEEFMKGVYLLDDPGYIADRALKAAPGSKLQMSTYSEHGYFTGDGDLLAGFLTAYKDDLDKYYDFSMASNTVPVGSVTLFTDNSFSTEYNGYFNASWPVYDSYAETISYLKDNGLWNGGCLEVPEIEKIKVSKTFYGGGSSEEDPVVYTDADDIEKVLSASLPTTYYSAWGRYGTFEHMDNEDLSIEVYPRMDILDNLDPGTFYYRQLLKDKTLP